AAGTRLHDLHVAGSISRGRRVVGLARHVRQPRSRAVVVSVRERRVKLGTIGTPEPDDESRGVHDVAGPRQELLKVVHVPHAREVGAELSGGLQYGRDRAAWRGLT